MRFPAPGKVPLLGAIRMRWLGHKLQLVGLILPPLGILLQLGSVISTGKMLTMLVAAVCLFFIGRILEGYSR